MDVFRHPCMCLRIYLGGWHVLRPEVRLRFYGFKVLRVMRTFDLALSCYIRTGGRVLGRRPLRRPARSPRGVPRLGPAPSRPPGRPGRPRGAPNVDPRPKDREGGEGCRNRQDGGGPKVPPQTTTATPLLLWLGKKYPAQFIAGSHQCFFFKNAFFIRMPSPTARCPTPTARQCVLSNLTMVPKHRSGTKALRPNFDSSQRFKYEFDGKAGGAIMLGFQMVRHRENGGVFFCALMANQLNTLLHAFVAQQGDPQIRFPNQQPMPICIFLKLRGQFYFAFQTGGSPLLRDPPLPLLFSS